MKPKFLKTLARKASRRLKRSTPTILTCLSAFGLVATTVSAVKATPKAMRLIEDAKQTDQYDLSKPEILCLTWKCYIPTVLIGTSTLACIFGANMLSRRQQAALSSAYALVSQSYKEYTDNSMAKKRTRPLWKPSLRRNAKMYPSERPASLMIRHWTLTRMEATPKFITPFMTSSQTGISSLRSARCFRQSTI